MEIGTSEAEAIWTGFLRKLTRRGLRGVKLVVSDAHEGIKTAVSKILCATWQRCRVHFMRNVLAHAGKSGRRVVSAFIATDLATAHVTFSSGASPSRASRSHLILLSDGRDCPERSRLILFGTPWRQSYGSAKFLNGS